MKKVLKKENLIYVFLFILLVFIHFPLMGNSILTADVLLNNDFYNGFSWEISLGRFGLFLVGICKSYLSFAGIDFFISSLLIVLITYFLNQLFEVKSLVSKLFLVGLMALSPIISATLLFHYCSIAYLLAFLGCVLAIFFFYHAKNKVLKYVVPLLLIPFSLSIYQAYFSLLVTLFVFYQFHLLFQKHFSYRDTLSFLLIFIGGCILYYLGMKGSQLIFHIDMASYSNANQIGLSTLLQFPKRIVSSYQLFYQMFFTDSIMKNTYLWNPILNGILFVLFICSFGYQVFTSKITLSKKILSILFFLLIPVFTNSVIFLIADSKLQLLMSASYLILFFYFLSTLQTKVLKISSFLVFGLLLRNYLIQDEATYLTLQNTKKQYDTYFQAAISEHIHELDKPFLVIGEVSPKNLEVSKRNYGYISDDGIFWEEYHLRKLGVERYVLQEFGLSITFGSEEDYQSLIEEKDSKEVLSTYRDNIVLDFSNT